MTCVDPDLARPSSDKTSAVTGCFLSKLVTGGVVFGDWAGSGVLAGVAMG